MERHQLNRKETNNKIYDNVDITVFQKIDIPTDEQKRRSHVPNNWQDLGVLRRELQNTEAGFSLSLSQKSLPFLLSLSTISIQEEKKVIWIGTE
ncbi:hypothetical protein E2320_010132 [Naja naja]|nr:hypothetical protein E2320_010132 [Naja naja]